MALTRRWGPAAVVAGLIFLLSSQRGLRVSDDAAVDAPVRHVAHVVVYALLTLAILHGLGGLGAGFSPRTAGIATAAAMLYGISDEVHQAFVPERTANLADLGYDALGALVGAAIAGVAAALMRRRRADH
jgi:VanZ family protein